MNYSYMNIFYTVATLGNISKAAEELFVSQPAISRVISVLEDEYNTKLFIRSKSGVTLTREGLNLFNMIKQPMQEFKKIESFIDSPGSLTQTVVDVGATATALEQTLLEQFEQYKPMFPNVNLRVHTDSSQKLAKMVIDGVIDFAFITTPHTHSRELEYYNTRSFTNILIAPASYKDKIKGKVSIKDLANYPFIFLNKKMQFRTHVDKYLASNGVHIDPAYETDSSGMLIPFVVSGCGLTFVPEKSADREIKEGKCFKIDLIEEMPLRYISFIIKKSKHYSPVVKELKQFVLNHIGK